MDYKEVLHFWVSGSGKRKERNYGSPISVRIHFGNRWLFLVPGEWNQGSCLRISWPNCLPWSLKVSELNGPGVIPLSLGFCSRCCWCPSITPLTLTPIYLLRSLAMGSYFRTQRRQDGVYTLLSSPQSMSWWINTPASLSLGWDNSGAYSTLSCRGPQLDWAPWEVHWSHLFDNTTCIGILSVPVSLLYSSSFWN